MTQSPLRTSTALKKLTRVEIQAMARREGLKSGGKTNEIIQRLLRKHPSGVPRNQTPGSLPGTKRKTRTITVNLSIKEEPEESHVSTRSTKRRRISPPLDDNATMASRVHPQPFIHVPEVIDETIFEAREVNPGKPRGLGPGPKQVRYVKRELAKLIQKMATDPQEITDVQTLLGEAFGHVRNMYQQTIELVTLRTWMEEGQLEDYKKDRTLWDGTGLMEPALAEKWTNFVFDDIDAMVEHYEEKMRKDDVEEVARQGALLDSTPAYSDSEISDSSQWSPKNLNRALDDRP